jgi:DNA-binding NarL/FixJ family response regulator
LNCSSHIPFGLFIDSGDGVIVLTLLSEREWKIIALVVEGLTNKDIARRLILIPTIIRSHISSILQKLNLTNRTQLAVHSLEYEEDGD